MPKRNDSPAIRPKPPITAEPQAANSPGRRERRPGVEFEHAPDVRTHHGYARRAAEVAAIYHRYLGLDESGLRFRRRTRLSTELAWPRLAWELRGRRCDEVFAGLQRFTEDLLADWVQAAVRATAWPGSWRRWGSS